MKKYFEATPNLDGLKEKIIVLKDGEDRKTLIAVIALVAAVLIAVTAGGCRFYKYAGAYERCQEGYRSWRFCYY